MTFTIRVFVLILFCSCLFQSSYCLTILCVFEHVSCSAALSDEKIKSLSKKVDDVCFFTITWRI